MRSQADSLDCAEISFASCDSAQDAPTARVSALCMNEAEFRAFYESTAPQLRAYLLRVTGDASVADDLLQESYLRLLRAPGAPGEEAHRRHYLFRVATNLLRDHFRVAKRFAPAVAEMQDTAHPSRNFALERDLGRFLAELKPRERELLWLAYVEGYRHDEIAKMMSCRSASVRPMLFRARQRLAEVLRARGWKRDSREKES